MSNKIMTGSLIIFFCLMAFAYAKPKVEAHKQITVDDIVAKMKVQLELTDQQVQGVRPIVENYLVKEQQLRLEEKKQLSKVLTSQQLYSWNFLQNEVSREKKKK